jgi:hypothetical protein
MQVDIKILESGHFVDAIDERSFEGHNGQWGASKKGDMRKSISGVAVTDDACSAVFGEVDMVGGEGGLITVIAKLADRDETCAGHSSKNVGLASAQR